MITQQNGRPLDREGETRTRKQVSKSEERIVGHVGSVFFKDDCIT